MTSAPQRNHAAVPVQPHPGAGTAATLVQLLAFVGFATGVYLLAGLGWALVIVCSIVGAGSVLVEWVATRTSGPLTGGDQ